MGILSTIFFKKDNDRNNNVAISTNNVQSNFNALTVHQDLKDLLWIADGPNKNYIPKDSSQTIEYEGIRIKFSSFSSQEPSLISIKLPIKKVNNPQDIERPSYFPTYAGLTEEQRGVYWNLLRDPYNDKNDIGYVFILYYGLERHLLEGDFENAFRVILKLRDVYDNASFQSYSACALIITCLIRQREDLLAEFYQSLDKNYELNFSDNLYLLCKMGLQFPLTAPDIIRMAKTFEFSNQNYIKKYPDLFLKTMTETMQTNLGAEELDINKYMKDYVWRDLPKQSIPIFSNISIQDKSINIPLISENFKLKKAIYDLLEQTHKKVKIELAKLRKEGATPTEKRASPTKVIEVLSFDSIQEKELLNQYKKACSNAIDKHFALIALQDFYYKYRKLDSKYLQICIDYCNEDIDLLPQVQSQYIREEKENIKKLSSMYSKREVAEQISAIGTFNGNIPAFKRLAIIFEKNKEYLKAIVVCNQAITYYEGITMYDAVAEFEQRKKKLESKVTKISK
ncbi:TerB N-terminal domain-containing protein [Turicibacter bilis]|uniref:TerB N-terminal domain-containing protein n=1 Tax=Turicibacter bilis TaxID=2735723 RepID=A0A9Q9CKK1_9FIRM|nr:TerB N-terminal domain-containing protein [Turicibacter bilis]MBS3197650.1 TerB N-terminal domain-containing protein [Turicibacter bilis]UUF08881.1 TerB N-terminal domain-containing protein [Turicibacter bilis]